MRPSLAWHTWQIRLFYGDWSVPVCVVLFWLPLNGGQTNRLSCRWLRWQFKCFCRPLLLTVSIGVRLTRLLIAEWASLHSSESTHMIVFTSYLIIKHFHSKNTMKPLSGGSTPVKVFIVRGCHCWSINVLNRNKNRTFAPIQNNATATQLKPDFSKESFLTLLKTHFFYSQYYHSCCVSLRIST